MNQKDRNAFFQQIQPKLSNDEFIELKKMVGDLESKNINLIRENKTLQEEIKKLNK